MTKRGGIVENELNVLYRSTRDTVMCLRAHLHKSLLSSAASCQLSWRNKKEPSSSEGRDQHLSHQGSH